MVGLPRRHALAVAVAGAALLVLGAGVVVGLSFLESRGDPVRLAAEIDQRFRMDEAAEVMPVLLRNNGDLPITVTHLELVAPSVVTAPETSSIIVRPGWTRRVRLSLRPTRCPERGAPSSGPAAAVATVASSEGASRQVRLPAPDPENVLDGVARVDCDVRRILRVADVGFGARWRRAAGDGDPLLRGHLVIARRTAGPPMTVTGARGSTVFTLRASSEPPWRLDADEGRMAIPVEFEATRCDPHALLESKKTYVFSAWAKLPGEKEQHLTLQPEPRLAGRLCQLIADGCRPT
ncbi:MAG: hypothetical protein GEV03_02265 [Streptosporangiales bacterium]|nr:hypothetical protein [Streptosporangiales bacterium]